MYSRGSLIMRFLVTLVALFCMYPLGSLVVRFLVTLMSEIKKEEES